jgi:hypothetical protein
MSHMTTQGFEGSVSEARKLKDIGVSPLCWGDITITRDTEGGNNSEIKHFIVQFRV